MAYKTEKTSQEWEKIRFQNSLGPQIGGLIHDAVALAIAVREQHKGYKDYDISADVKIYLDTLYKIAENKKAEITTPKPVDLEKAEELGEQWKKDRIEAERIRIGAKYQEKEEKTNYRGKII